MRSPFPGFPAEAIQFFRGLRRNNNRDWFQARKPVFDASVKGPMLELVDALNRGLAGFAPEFVTDPEKAVFRIYRDTRFSKDKTPYKDRIAASFSRRGMPKTSAGGYYFSVSDKEIEVGGGAYRPAPDVLLAIRRHIAGSYEQFREIIGNRTVKRQLGDLQGDRLSRVPKGFACDHPAADLLRFKDYILFTTLPAEIAMTPRLYTELLKRFEAMVPFIEFLSAPLVRSSKKPPAKPARFDDRRLPVAF